MTAIRTEADTMRTTGTSAIRPFRFEASQQALDTLRQRIAATQWPEKETVPDSSQGVPLATMQALARYWATDYDWRKAETKLNALPQFTTEIDGVDIHFIHVKSPHENALPLIITHGWPGLVIEMLETVGPLTDPTAHGGRLGGADEPPRLHPLRRPGRRRRRLRHRRDGTAGTRGAARHPHQPARGGPGR